MTNELQRIEECVRLQDQMNTVVNPEWKKAHYPFFRAAWLECGELIDHLGWKWWKKETPDREQVVLEIVDIFHFFLSDCILRDRSAATILGSYLSAVRKTRSDGDKEYQIRTVENFVETSLINDHHGLGMTPVDFFAIPVSFGVGIDELLTKYVSKNCLNIFRQDHGYKAGTYVKEWFGEEDNVWLVRFRDELSHSLTFQNLYAKLEEKYKEATQQ